MTKPQHIPVLPNEVLEYLAPQPDGVYWDLTLGLGGHGRLILEATSPTGKLVGVDCDPQALEVARERLEAFGCRLITLQSNYAHIYDLFDQGKMPPPDGILMDLGVSSLQLDQGERGFSFSKPAPLDMRMDPTLPQTAADILNTAGQEELTRILWEYGEEKKSRQIAREIVARRGENPLKLTTQLADIVSRIVPGQRIHPATRTFQALRIAVNDELNLLEQGLQDAFQLLKPGGRLVVISFHSLEDRRAKQAFRSWEKERKGEILTSKPVTPQPREVEENPRSRSSKLRAFRKAT